MLYQIWLPIYFSLVRYAITMAHWDLALKAVKIFKQPFCLHENGDAMGDNQMRWVCHGNFDWKVMVGHDCCFFWFMFSCSHPCLGACSIHSCGWVKATTATAEEFPDSCHWSPLRRQQIQLVSTLQHAKNHPMVFEQTMVTGQVNWVYESRQPRNTVRGGPQTSYWDLMIRGKALSKPCASHVYPVMIHIAIENDNLY